MQHITIVTVFWDGHQFEGELNNDGGDYFLAVTLPSGKWKNLKVSPIDENGRGKYIGDNVREFGELTFSIKQETNHDIA